MVNAIVEVKKFRPGDSRFFSLSLSERDREHNKNY